MKNYHYCITKFCNIVHKSPSEIINEAEEDEDKLIKPLKQCIMEYFLQFIQSASEKDYKIIMYETWPPAFEKVHNF